VPVKFRYPLPISPKVSSHLYCPQSLVIPVLSAVSGHPCAARSLWSSLCCPQSLVIPVLSAVSGHLLYCTQCLVMPCTVCSLWSSPVLCPQSLVHLLYCVRSLWSISCTVSAVSGHLLYYVLSLWSSPVLCPQSLVLLLYCVRSLWSSLVLSAVSGHLLYCVRSVWSLPVLCLQ
ncbi:unnamed protein product, partial [Staurois parvus]